MRPSCPDSCARLAVALASLASVAPASAQLIMVLDGAASAPIVSVTLSGSDTASGSVDYSICCGGFFDIIDGSDPFGAPLQPLSSFSFVGEATFGNITTGTVFDVLDIGLQNKATDPFADADRFGVEIAERPTYSVSTGDVFAWEGFGTVDLSQQGMIFDDLIVGTYQAAMWLPGLGHSGLDATLVVTPTPGACLVFAAVLGHAARRPRLR